MSNICVLAGVLFRGKTFCDNVGKQILQVSTSMPSNSYNIPSSRMVVRADDNSARDFGRFDGLSSSRCLSHCCSCSLGLLSKRKELRVYASPWRQPLEG